MSQTFIPIAKTSDIPLGQVRVFEHQDQEIAVCNVEGRFYAVENLCSHDDGPLDAGHTSDLLPTELCRPFHWYSLSSSSICSSSCARISPSFSLPSSGTDVFIRKSAFTMG